MWFFSGLIAEFLSSNACYKPYGAQRSWLDKYLFYKTALGVSFFTRTISSARTFCCRLYITLSPVTLWSAWFNSEALNYWRGDSVPTMEGRNRMACLQTTVRDESQTIWEPWYPSRKSLALETREPRFEARCWLKTTMYANVDWCM